MHFIILIFTVRGPAGSIMPSQLYGATMSALPLPSNVKDTFRSAVAHRPATALAVSLCTCGVRLPLALRPEPAGLPATLPLLEHPVAARRAAASIAIDGVRVRIRVMATRCYRTLIRRAGCL